MADFYRVHFGKLLKNNVTFKGIPEALSKERSRVMDFGCGCGKVWYEIKTIIEIKFYSFAVGILNFLPFWKYLSSSKFCLRT